MTSDFSLAHTLTRVRTTFALPRVWCRDQRHGDRESGARVRICWAMTESITCAMISGGVSATAEIHRFDGDRNVPPSCRCNWVWRSYLHRRRAPPLNRAAGPHTASTHRLPCLRRLRATTARTGPDAATTGPRTVLSIGHPHRECRVSLGVGC